MTPKELRDKLDTLAAKCSTVPGESGAMMVLIGLVHNDIRKVILPALDAMIDSHKNTLDAMYRAQGFVEGMESYHGMAFRTGDMLRAAIASAEALLKG